MMKRLRQWIRKCGLFDVSPQDARQAARVAFLTTLACLVFPAMAAAQQVNINLGTGVSLCLRLRHGVKLVQFGLEQILVR